MLNSISFDLIRSAQNIQFFQNWNITCVLTFNKLHLSVNVIQKVIKNLNIVENSKEDVAFDNIQKLC